MPDIRLNVLGQDKHYGPFCPAMHLRELESPCFDVLPVDWKICVNTDHLYVRGFVIFLALQHLVTIMKLTVCVDNTYLDLLFDKFRLILIIVKNKSVP